MILSVTCPGGLGTPEWIILELQGKLLPAPTVGVLDEQLMGKLEPHPSGDADKFILQVGTYKCTGSLVTLKKPLGVVQRVAADASSSSGGMEVEGSETAPSASSPPSFELRATVRRKFIFDERPQPMIGGMTGTGAASAGTR